MGRENSFKMYEEPIRTEYRESDSRDIENFYEGLTNRRTKVAQLGDASVAFITMKKHAMEKCAKCGSTMMKEKCSNADCGEVKMAGLISSAKGVGTRALNAVKKNPAITGAAVGAAGGAIAGGPDHRLSGAAAGAGLGAAAGHGAGKLMARGAAKAAPAAAAKAAPAVESMANPANVVSLPNPNKTAVMPAKGPHNITKSYGPGEAPGSMSAAPATPAPAPSGPTPVPWEAAPGTARAQVQAAANLPMPAGARTSGLAEPGRVPTMPSTPVAKGTAPGVANQSPDAVAAARQEMMGGTPMGVGQAKGTGPAPGWVPPPSNKTQVMQKAAAWLPPFVVADGPSNAASSGGLSAVKVAFKMPKIPASTITNIVEEMADLGRRKLQSELSVQAEKRRRKEKNASPYDDTSLMDMRQRAAEKYPERVSPIEAIRTDFKKALKLLSDKVHDLRTERTDIASPKIAMQNILHHDVPLNANEFRAHREKIAAEAGLDMKEMAQMGGMPKTLMTPRGAGFAGAGALIGGAMGFLGSRGKPELGGKSKVEVELGAARDRQPEKPDGIGATIGKHVTNIHADVAEQMRKHPVVATLTGAGVGAGLALRVASMLGK